MLGNINSETMRATNLQVIFDYIRRNEPASRRDIAEFGGLTVAAVSNITSKLLANGLVVEVGAGESVGGRRPTLLGINADCRYAVGIDLTTKQMKLVITNFKAQIMPSSSSAFICLGAADINTSASSPSSFWVWSLPELS